MYQSFQKMFNGNQNKFATSNDSINEIQSQIRELQEERYKLQTEKLENNRWLRENARDELILEKILAAIDNLSPLPIPDVLPIIYKDRKSVV